MKRNEFIVGGALFAATALFPKVAGAKVTQEPVTLESLKAVAIPNFMTTITPLGKMHIFDKTSQNGSFSLHLTKWRPNLSDEEFQDIIVQSRSWLLDQQVLGIHATIPNLGEYFIDPPEFPVTVSDITSWTFDHKGYIDVYYSPTDYPSRVGYYEDDIEYGVFHEA